VGAATPTRCSPEGAQRAASRTRLPPPITYEPTVARLRSSHASVRLEIRLLGDLAVLRNGGACSLPPSKKTRALLAYLVVTGRPCSRERLCELLWEIPDDPRGALRWSLSRLRPLVADAAPHLIADRERVAFETNSAEVDLLEVRSLAARGLRTVAEADLVTALQRFRGPFLEGLDLPDCVRFYTWCVSERERARAIHVALLKELLDRCRDRPEEALLHARALVALDPIAESSHLEVMRLLASAGRVSEAIEEYDRTRRILSEQMGARPTADLERMRASLAAPVRPPSPPPIATHETLAPNPPPIRGLPRLVGREMELCALSQLLPGSPGRSPQRVGLLVGCPGIGKTRVLQELASRAAGRGIRVLQGRSFEAEAVRPYGVWVEAMRAVPAAEVPDHLRTDLAVLLPELGASVPNGDQPRLFDAIVELLRGARRTGPGVLVLLDDIQWMDVTSASLLHYIARAAGGGETAVVVCAARTGELEDNAAVAMVLRGLEREHRLARLEIAPLSPDESAALARDVWAGVDARRVQASARGNPLFVMEMARALSRGEAGASATLARTVRDRLLHLGEADQAVLTWAAALGRRFEASVLARVSGIPVAGLLDALGKLERHGVLSTSGGAGYDFAHDVTREAAYALLSEPRRRLVHIQIAHALWTQDSPPAADILHHAALAGEHELAARACVAAGQRCLRVFAYADARELSRRGIDHAAHLPDHSRIPLEVELYGLRTARPSAELDEIASDLDRLGRAAERAGLMEAAMRAFHFRSLILFGSGDHARALASSVLAAQAARIAPSTVAARNLLLHARCLAILERDMRSVARTLDEAVVTLGPDPPLLDFRWTRGLLRRFQGADGVLEDLAWAAAQTASEERHWERSWCLLSLAVAALEKGDAVSAERWAVELEEVASHIGDGVEQPAAHALRAMAALSTRDEGWEALDAALDRVREADGKVMLAVLANLASERAAALGQQRRARRYAEAALAAATAVDQPSEVLLARAQLVLLALRRGDDSGAAEMARALDSSLALGPWATTARARAAASVALAAVASRHDDTPAHDASFPVIPEAGG